MLPRPEVTAQRAFSHASDLFRRHLLALSINRFPYGVDEP
jgi:hypothetical protein